jgi:hypothetical protein
VPKGGIKEGPLPYADSEDNDDEVVFSFKCNASFIDKKTNKVVTIKPGIFDTKKKPCNPRIGGGSVLRVAFEMLPYYTAIAGAGVSLRLKSVQVLELKEYGNGGASAEMFAEEEGGFEGSEETEAEAPAEKPAAEKSEEEAPAGEGSDF